MQYTVKYRYNAVQFITILHSALRKQWQKVNQILESQEAPHISPSSASYWVPIVVSIVMILEKIDRVLTAPHFITAITESDKMPSFYNSQTIYFI